MNAQAAIKRPSRGSARAAIAVAAVRGKTVAMGACERGMTNLERFIYGSDRSLSTPELRRLGKPARRLVR